MPLFALGRRPLLLVQALSGSIKIQQLEKPYMEVKAEAKLGQDIEAGVPEVKSS